MQNIRLLKASGFLNEALKPNCLYLWIAICASASASLKLVQNLTVLAPDAGGGCLPHHIQLYNVLQDLNSKAPESF